jgi:hypothetical protein
MPKVHAPNRAYGGTVGDVRFEGGVADVPEDHRLMSYFRSRGYGVGSEPTTTETADQEYPPVEETSSSLGRPLRDAAVDPQPEDYLEPVNAGKAHPHSPEVVSPGIHAVPPAPIRPGEVYVDDVERQESEELALAEKVLVNGEPATVIASDEPPGGPLGLSDPGSVDAGQRNTRPAGSAKKATWVDYAVSLGASREEAEDMTLNQLREQYG